MNFCLVLTGGSLWWIELTFPCNTLIRCWYLADGAIPCGNVHQSFSLMHLFTYLVMQCVARLYMYFLYKIPRIFVINSVCCVNVAGWCLQWKDGRWPRYVARVWPFRPLTLSLTVRWSDVGAHMKLCFTTVVVWFVVQIDCFAKSIFFNLKLDSVSSQKH